MPLPSPNLDDRTFEQLVLEAKEHILRTCPGWTDLSPHDPGVILVEVFAHLTETMIYRLNRLPEKAYVEFLRLLGVKLQPPAAASVRLTFSVDAPAKRPVEIPTGTRVTTARAGGGTPPIVFTVAEDARLPEGATHVDVLALHAERVDGERVGVGTGRPGLWLQLKRPPVVAPTGTGLDLVVGVESLPGEIDARAPARRAGEKIFRIWREVDSFTDTLADPYVYLADRNAGTLTFAPATQRRSAEGTLDEVPQALAAVPALGREIFAWYVRGGGPEGNLSKGTLETLKDPIPGVKVTNAVPAVGGRAAESLENALLRGPQEVHSLRRAVTARDFELLALRSSSGIARAKALTQAQLWRHAPAGTVEVLLVPDLPPSVRGPADRGVTISSLQEHQTEGARARIQSDLEQRRPLGTDCAVTWALYKEVVVTASVVAHRAEDLAALRERLLERLYRTINPLPTAARPQGWNFGQALRASNAYDLLLSEPGVSYVDQVRLLVKDVPQGVKTLAADGFQPRTWYAGGGERLYRTMNDGDGWEPCGVFAGEDVDGVETHPTLPGLLAVSTRLAADATRSRLHLSTDCGESWEANTQTLDAVEDLAWTLRQGVAVLLLATRVGLFELSLLPGARPLQVVVDPARQDLGFWAVAASTDFRGATSVAVAAMEARGVWLSPAGGAGETFKPIGLQDQDVRVLEVQHDGPRSFLWAGLAAASGADPGKGCVNHELLGGSTPVADWRAFDRNWDGGSCLSLAFIGSSVFAGTHRAGVLSLDASRDGASWRRPDVGSGLPLREKERLFQPLPALAAMTDPSRLLTGGPGGVFRSAAGDRYEPCTQSEFTEKVTLPPTWLFCSGPHEIEVTHDASQGD